MTNAFFNTFGKSNFWSGEVTGSEANAYFVNEIIGTGTVGEDMMPTRLVWKNVGYSLLVWLVVRLRGQSDGADHILHNGLPSSSTVYHVGQSRHPRGCIGRDRPVFESRLEVRLIIYSSYR